MDDGTPGDLDWTRSRQFSVLNLFSVSVTLNTLGCLFSRSNSKGERYQSEGGQQLINNQLLYVL